MIKEIMDASGIEYRRARFLQPPEGTYAVYTDDVSAGGADRFNCLYTHDITVELYEPSPDDDAEAAIEAALDAAGVEWSKQDRYWLSDVQRYQVLYEFTYITKRRIKDG